MPLDLESLKRAATAGDGADEVPVTRRMLARIVEEISAGRAAHAQLGQVFGLPQGVKL